MCTSKLIEQVPTGKVCQEGTELQTKMAGGYNHWMFRFREGQNHWDQGIATCRVVADMQRWNFRTTPQTNLTSRKKLKPKRLISQEAVGSKSLKIEKIMIRERIKEE